ncbi:MAG: desulfoferrodoxin family protein [Eubacteriales bacterium]|nr:desulfoferrodoxin family protein [Eubacteriales bacterium]
MKVFKSKVTGTVVVVAEDHGGVLSVNGEEMVELKANTTDGATEKHVPAVTVEGNKLTAVVGSVPHPMTEEHYIGFILAVTNKGVHKRTLDHTGEAKAEFALLDDEKAVTVYEYCNLHGLWKVEL